MKSKMIKFLKAIIFIFLFTAIFYVVTVTLRFKDDIGIHQMQDFYLFAEDEFDVVCIGSSHVGANIDREILLEEYGIKDYNLWAAVQPAWNSYYYLKEVFKQQSPELICLELFVVAQDLEESDYARVISNTMGMRFSEDKIEAVKASIAGEQQRDILLGWPTYHMRYTELNENDFSRYFWNYKMASGKIDSGYDVFSEKKPEVVDSGESIPLYEKQEVYLRKIIELCQEKQVPLLLFVTPYNAPEKDQLRFNRIREIAEEYGEGVYFKNFMEDISEIPIVFEKDYADGGGHLNNVGVEKFTMYIGRYLRENFEISYSDEEFANKFNLSRDYKRAYRMRDIYAGNAVDGYINTGQKLYDDPDRDWTVLADFNTNIYSYDQVYFACYAEEPGDYRGLLVKRQDNMIYIVVGDNYYNEVEVRKDGSVRVAISKEGSRYNIYANDQKVAVDINSSCRKYDGELVVGCELDESGAPFRYSASTVYELEVYNETVSKKDIMRWLREDRTVAASAMAQIQESIRYTMEEEFVGNGIDTYHDTGTHLYDNPIRSWTLLTELDLTCNKESEDLVFLSCFSETPGENRGLLIRYGEDKIETILGNTYYLDIPDNGKESIKIAIVKEENLYSVYADGRKIAADISSYCASYMGNLLVGCEEMNGEPFRFSPVTVKRLEVYDEILTFEEIREW